jgi:integrase
VADFLVDQFEAGKQLSTLEGYRTAIAGALKIARGVDFGSDPKLSALLLSFRRERPRSASSPVPPWDLAFVLWSLSQSPFKPVADESTPLKFLTWKCVFLLLLASGSRRSEIHALSGSEISHAPDWKYVSLKPIPGFLSKTALRSSGASVFEGIRIRALSTVIGPDLPDDRKLCPVRTLKAYLSRTKSFRKDHKRLFISYQEGRQADISKNTISAWVKKLLKFVYNSGNPKACQLTGLSVHSIRGMASSWAFRGTVSVDDILKACTWSSHTTFTDFYLKDMSEIKEGLLCLGPLVVAQSVVHPKDVR